MKGIGRWLANFVTGGDYSRCRERAEMERQHYLSAVDYGERQSEMLLAQTAQTDKLRGEHAKEVERLARDMAAVRQAFERAEADRDYYQAEAEVMCRSLNRFMAAHADKDRQYDAASIQAEALRREVERQRRVIGKLREERDICSMNLQEHREVLAEVREKLEQAHKNDTARDPKTGRFVRRSNRANRGTGRSTK